jgi:pyochelin synthetase
MSYLDVLRDVEARGLSLSVSGTDLRLQGPQQRVDAELVGRIKAAKAELVAHLTAQQASAAPQPSGYPLTLLQRGYLIGRGDSVEIGNVASHVYHEIDGCWDLDRLEQALRRVVARHGMLRTSFTADGRQVEAPAADIGIIRYDLRGEPPAAQQARLAELREQRSHRIFPYDQAPMLAVEASLLGPSQMRLHVGHDGLVMDGISMFLFFRDWWRAYTGTDEPGVDEPGGQVSFADYVTSAQAMRSKAPAQRSRSYWLDRLPDLPPHPGLALKTSPASISHPRFTQYTAVLDAPSWATLKGHAAAAGLTPTGVLLAAYAETLARWGAGRRFTLTTTVANRPPIHPRMAEAIGNFSETLLVEIDIDRNRTFTERAQALQARLRRDLDHRHFSGIEVLRELARLDSSADARMPYTFNSTIGYVLGEVDGSTLELLGPEVYTSSQTPQVWLNAFAFEQHGGVVVQFDAVDGLFPDGMIAAMTGGYQRMLDALLDEGSWSSRTFHLLPPDQSDRRLLVNNTAVARPDQMLPDAFAAQAARDPDAPAVLTTTGTVSYGDLLRQASDAAAWLRERQVARDELVALIMHRGPEQITGIMAALMAGGAYLPVDARLPDERIRYMLRDGRVRCVLTNSGWQAGDEDAVEVLDLIGRKDALQSSIGRKDALRPYGLGYQPLPGTSPDDLAYVLYTSGTTGEPKGVMISHRSVANVVADCNERFSVTPADRFIALSAFNFDLSAYDIFGALSAGAALVLPDAGRATDPAHWLELCDRFGVTIWNSVPAIAGLMAEQAVLSGPEFHPTAGLRSLRLVMMSGDRIPPALPATLARLKDDLTLMSLGGPTETTIWNISYPIGVPVLSGPERHPTAGSQSIPYGRPNANNRAYILDADGLDCPDWVTGEICAAGTGLARGYWADEARTADKFWFDSQRGERLYRTGDLGCYLPDGNIAIAGRSDFQIKVNGYRIEAGEVETRLADIHAVKQAVVVRQAAARGDRLVAHLVPAGDARPTPEEIRQALREHLPDYMTPAEVVWHDSLPLTANGKVDRGKLTLLSGPERHPTAVRAEAGPGGGDVTTDLERELMGVWASVLRVPADAIGHDSNFYDLGGDSLAAARIFTGIRKQFGVSITLDRLYEVQTVRAMAACIESGAR